MNWSNWIRQIHRWLAAAFTVGFVVNSVVIFVLGQKQPASWVYLLALIPLFLLPTGLYLFALPYAAKWGAQWGVQRRAGGVGAVSE